MLVRRCQQASEAVLLVMVCLAPWAFGAVEPHPEFVLFAGAAILAVLNLIAGWGTDRFRALSCAPSLALAGLAILAAAQSRPLSDDLLRRLSPATASLRAGLVPRVAEKVRGDEKPPVPLPAATISQDPDVTLQTAARLAAGWVIFQCVLGLGRGAAPLRRFAIALAANATLLSLFSLIQMLTWNGKIYWIRESPSGNGGPFVCHNHLAAYLNLGLGVALAYLALPNAGVARGQGRGRRVWAAYATGLIFVGLVASLSRSGFLAMAGTLVIAIIAIRPNAVRVGSALAMILVLVPLFFLALGSVNPYQERLGSVLDSQTYDARFAIWRSALRIVPHYPIWGLGLGTFPTASVRFFTSDATEHWAHAENEYVEWLVEGGAVGIGLIALAVVGTARLGRRALPSLREPGDRTAFLGLVFGMVTLLIHSMGDFAMHMPAVAVAAVVLAAYLAKQGLEARDLPAGRLRRSLSPIVALVAIPVAVLCVIRGYDGMMARDWYAAGGIFNQGLSVSLAGDEKDDVPTLERRRVALTHALGYLPISADTHLRLGLVNLRLFELKAREALAEFEKDPAEVASMARPIWWFKLMHPDDPSKAVPVSELLDDERIRVYLVPAAREFLEARRCCMVLPSPHSCLALVDYLLEGGDPPGAYLSRAIRLAGNDQEMLRGAQNMALMVLDADLLARCLRLRLGFEVPGVWEEIADLAKQGYPPREILERIVPSGKYALWFALRLYKDPAEKDARDLFLREAVRRLEADRKLPPAERAYMEAQAWFHLGDREHARERMGEALQLEPKRAEWRREFIDWLLAWGAVKDAHQQALVGLYYTPDRAEIREAQERVAEAMAGGEKSSDKPVNP